jgi:hypothetical protein
MTLLLLAIVLPVLFALLAVYAVLKVAAIMLRVIFAPVRLLR